VWSDLRKDRFPSSFLPAPLFFTIPAPKAILIEFRSAHVDHDPTFPSIIPIFVGLVIFFVINVIFIINIELTLQQIRSTNESSWTFGQTLSLLLLVLPLRDLVDMEFGCHEEARQEELARREKAHNNNIVRHKNARQDEQNTSPQNSSAAMQTWIRFGN
jgi:hypothetical protein